ncbi:hypothetical protein SAMN05216436_10164 [bacterium A37T11]|nr:hypothetical protein SAMN05216436_10164 [bacterium A37T11]
MSGMNLLKMIIFTMMGMGGTALAEDSLRFSKNIDVNEGPVYFDLQSGSTIDSATGRWDVIFYKTGIRLHPDVSAQLVKNTTFDQLRQAPAKGYRKDGHKGPAIPTGSGKAWYNYDLIDHYVQPIPGRLLLLRTAGGMIAKLEFLTYYRDDDIEYPGYITFRYQFIPAVK